MNKLMLIPYGIYMMLAVLTLVGGISYNTASMDYQEVTSDGTSVMSTNTSSNTGSATFDLFATGFLLFIGSLVVIAVLSGIQIFGSGLSAQAQSLMFKSLIYFGIYFALVACASPWLFADGSGKIGLLIFFVLTIMFVLGFVQDQNKVGA